MTSLYIQQYQCTKISSRGVSLKCPISTSFPIALSLKGEQRKDPKKKSLFVPCFPADRCSPAPVRTVSYLCGALRIKFHLILLNGIYLAYKSIVGFSTRNIPKGFITHIQSLFQQIFIKCMIDFSNCPKCYGQNSENKKKKNKHKIPSALLQLLLQ